MPRRRNGEIPLPEGWDYAQDYDGKVYFIDHNNKKTTWMDPRDRYTKPQTFADCIGNELPLGWEEAYDAQIGAYYINHVKQCTQLEDPRLEWRAVQQAMLRDYLQTAQDALEAKKEIYDIKQQRLHLAQDEYNHLNNALSTFTTSRTSLCSSGSSTSTKYDPDLLKSDVALAKNRVSRLKCELEQIRTEMTCTQRGVDTLTSVEHKLSTHSGGGCYNINEAQAIMTELRNIQKSLSSGEKEKAELMQSLAKLKDDLTRLQLSESTSDISTLSIPPLTSSSSVASQTDLSGELPPIGTRLAEMARKRLQYDEARKRIQHIQQQLADLEEKVQPGQVESDKDRLLLFQEKEQLLRELRSITPRTRSKQEMCDIQLECKRLEQDLNMALEMSNRTIADRLRLHEEKQLLLQQLRDSLRLMTVLESELKILSASTLSVSSSSSLGSLSTTSSKGSLSSALSFTDIYGGPQCTGIGAPGVQPGKPIDMVDLHKRVERLLSPRSSLTSDQHPPPPAYDQIRTRLQFDNLDNPDLRPSSKNTSCIDLLPLSPISETPPPLLDEMLKVAALSRTASSSGTNTRSVSAAVSDESVAGDSGVFEASNKKRLMMMVAERVGQSSDGASNSTPSKHDGEHHHHQHSVDDSNLETSQIQIKLRYAIDDSMLNIEIERLRNLAALFVPENCQVYVKAALLPSTPTMTFATKPVKDLRKPTFGENFPFEVPFSKLFTKTLQVNVWSLQRDNLQEDCLGCAQVSLADFSPETISVKWYNILSFRFMQPDQTKCTFNNYTISASVGTSSSTNTNNKQEVDSTSAGGVYHQESSDESTIISSQTSTLTRSQEGCDNLQAAINMKLEELRCYNNMASSSTGVGATTLGDDLLNSESDDDDDEDSDESDCDHLLDFRNIEEDILEGDEEEGLEEPSEYVVVESIDKETNTECAFFPDHSKHKHSAAGVGCTLNNNLLERSLYIKRSQTFSPSASSCVPKTRCRLNRSDSDSAMQLYRRGGGPFQRNTFERRSLRWRRPSASMAMLAQHPTPSGHHGEASKSSATTVTARTSLDLELDLQAQHTRLYTLNDELQRLRELKQRLEQAKEQGDTELVTWVLEDQQFQNLIAQAEGNKLGGGKTLEEKKIEKMLKKTSKEIYKLRKSKAGKGKPDIISFKEKMAFFTRVNSNIPILPQTDNELQQTTSKDNNNGQQPQQLNDNNKDDNDSDSSTEGSKRYEYVVDRVLGVEV